MRRRFAGNILRVIAPVAAMAIAACAPKVYVIDRQTVLEQEAAGDWPEFEKELVSKSTAAHPTAFPKVPVNNRKTRLYNVLNGEMLSSAPASTPAPKSASKGSVQ